MKTILINEPLVMASMISRIKDRKVLFMDTETSGLDPYTDKLLLIQICAGTGEPTYVIPYHRVTDYERYRLRETLSSKELVFHNAKFDLKFLYHNLDLPISSPDIKVFDTQLAESVLSAGKAVGLMKHTSLANTMLRRYGIDLSKEVRQEFIGHDGVHFTEQQIDYAARDVEVLIKLRKDQIKEAEEWGLTDTLRLEFDLVKHVAIMEMNGVLIDVVKWREILDEQVNLKEQTYAKLTAAIEPYMEQQSLFGEISFNVNSQVELLRFLQERLGLDIENTAEQTLNYANHPICDLILEYREHEKLIKSFGEALLQKINQVTGRLHPDFNQCNTATGRFSSSNPNVQQIPSRGAGAALRECFIAPLGCKIICSDYSQIELRILAELSEEPAMLQAYENGIDIHTQTASIAFGIPTDKVTSENRKIAKILNFATVYGGGPRAIAKGIVQVISEDEATKILEEQFNKSPDKNGAYYCLAREFVASYFRGLPKAQQYLEQCADQAISDRYSATPLGRKRFYDTEFDTIQALKGTDEYEEKLEELVSSVKRRAKNHPIQGCSADITKLAIMKIGQEFYRHYPSKARILLQVHDELVVECDEEVVDEVVKLQEESMIWAGKQFLSAVDVKVDTTISSAWAKE